MDLMKPIANENIPTGEEWLYEVKFDGFRCILHWEENNIKLTSKNNIDLTDKFPEIIAYCRENQSLVSHFFPIKLDGELVVLNNAYQANFALIKERGSLTNKNSIQKMIKFRPASFMAFDILHLKNEKLYNKSYQCRKELLAKVLTKMTLHSKIRLVKPHENAEELWQMIYAHKGEGLIAKRKSSVYCKNKSHHDWFKIKNWRNIKCFLTKMDQENGYFSVAVYDEGKIKTIGKCKHGLREESMETLKEIFLTKGDIQGNNYALPPAICASINTLDLHKGALREPTFKELLPNLNPINCTIEQLNLDMAMVPPKIELTNTNKIFWPDKKLTKGNLLSFIREVSPYMLPFLQDKALTVIRSPDGVEGESFFQKNLPDYTPSFINSIKFKDSQLIVCNTLESLIWFANHGAIEYHVPFQKINDEHPNEIVFDLDPPDRDRFNLAIKAALMIKPLLDELNLTSFVKTSGNKGLQIHIPISIGSMTYHDTALFTQAIAWTVEGAFPNLFTTERFKKNRGERLYIDYLQHGKDKTLIAPYSPRKTPDATVATPLFWEEVKEGLIPNHFTIENVVERVQTIGCPFSKYFDAGMRQELDKVLKLIND